MSAVTGWNCTVERCTRRATRTVFLKLPCGAIVVAASMRICSSPACESSARASLAAKVEVSDGI